MSMYYIRKARVDDVKVIHGLLTLFGNKGLLLPRSYNELYSRLRELFVVSPLDSGEIKGCCALSIVWEDWAEIRSLAIDPDMHGKGWGKRLVEACLSEALTLGIFRIFTLTTTPAFFSKVGFKDVDKNILPQKIWVDCIHCPKFPDCDEVAMLMEL